MVTFAPEQACNIYIFSFIITLLGFQLTWLLQNCIQQEPAKVLYKPNCDCMHAKGTHSWCTKIM